MKIFENKVGRPSKEILKKRNAIRISIVLLLLAVVLTFTFQLNKINNKKLKGELSNITENQNYEYESKKTIATDRTSYDHNFYEIGDYYYAIFIKNGVNIYKYDKNFNLIDQKVLDSYSEYRKSALCNNKIALYVTNNIIVFDENLNYTTISYEGDVDSMTSTLDGNLLIGDSKSSNSQYSIVLTKINLDTGSTIFNKSNTFDVEYKFKLDEDINKLYIDTDGNFLIPATTSLDGTKTTVLLKFDSNGNFLQKKDLFNARYSFNIKDIDGKYVICGNMQDNNSGKVLVVNKDSLNIEKTATIDHLYMCMNISKKNGMYEFYGNKVEISGSNYQFYPEILTYNSELNLIDTWLDSDNKYMVRRMFKIEDNKLLLAGLNETYEKFEVLLYEIKSDLQIEDDKSCFALDKTSGVKYGEQVSYEDTCEGFNLTDIVIYSDGVDVTELIEIDKVNKKITMPYFDIKIVPVYEQITTSQTENESSVVSDETSNKISSNKTTINKFKNPKTYDDITKYLIIFVLSVGIIGLSVVLIIKNNKK